jgi:hypothetical protein
MSFMPVIGLQKFWMNDGGVVFGERDQGDASQLALTAKCHAIGHAAQLSEPIASIIIRTIERCFMGVAGVLRRDA